MIVLDTHVLIWAISDEAHLGRKARTEIEETARSDRVAVSAITPWEITMLVEKSRLQLGQDVRVWIENSLARPGVYLAPIEPAIAIDSVRLPGDFHADLADRFIVATARYYNAPLLTADSAILSYATSGYVQVIDAMA